MKKTMLFGFAVAVIALAGYAWAERVNPASNVTGDSDATAETIVYRNSSNASTLYTLTVSNAITVPDNAIDTTKVTGTWILSDLASNSVDSNKILDGSVSLADLRTGSVDSNKVIDGTLYNAEIAATAAIDSSKISGTWLAANIKANVINTTKLENVSTPATGTLLCYTNDGKIGKVTAIVDTGVTGTCAAF